MFKNLIFGNTIRVSDIPSLISEQKEGFIMSYIAPAIKEKFESLSPGLQSLIMEQNIQLNNIHDLIHVLEKIVAEDEANAKAISK